jgi:uncharacterized protein (DUF2236 family)
MNESSGAGHGSPGAGHDHGPAPSGAALGPGSVVGDLVQEARWGLAVVRAVLLEAAHPEIGAALMTTSTFVAHPWRRVRNSATSIRRLADPDEATRLKEADRLNRLHARVRGVDERGREFSGLDPQARTWVLASLFESTVTMLRLSGESLDGPTMERLYAEHQAMLALFGDARCQLPATLEAFWPYYDRVLTEELENTDAVHLILDHLLDRIPPPPVLRSRPGLWTASRTFTGAFAGMLMVASLPEQLRGRLGLPEFPGAQTLMQGTFLSAGLAGRLLPERWTRIETLMELLDGGGPTTKPPGAVRRRALQARSLLRFATRARPDVNGDNATERSAEQFFAEVLDQTGNGFLDWPDIAAMAREIAGRLDLDEDDENRLYDAYADWWRELQSELDEDRDGRITRQEYAHAVAELPGKALIKLADVLFDVTDVNDSQSISAQEYQALFRTAFNRDMADSEGEYSRSEFTREFLAFMAGRQTSTSYDSMLSQE